MLNKRYSSKLSQIAEGDINGLYYYPETIRDIMEINHTYYNCLKSFERIDNIINNLDYFYEEVKYIPSKGKLTFNNDHYVDCASMFVDIRGSSELPSIQKDHLAKLY